VPRNAALKPSKRGSRLKAGLAPWVVNVPPDLSETKKRQELFFETEKEAKAECEKLKGRRDNFGLSLQNLTAHEIHEAAKAFELLHKHPGITLINAVRGYLEVVADRSKSVSWERCFAEYEALPKKRSPKYLKDVTETKDSLKALDAKLLVDITGEDLNTELSHLAASTRNARMRILRAVFNVGIKRRWLALNPVAQLDFADLGTGEVEIFTPDETKKFLETVQRNAIELLPYFVFGFFCGIRPDGELQKLLWSDVKRSEKTIVIRPEVAKGGRRRRFVTISPNAAAWLRVYQLAGGKCDGPVTPYEKSRLTKKRRELQTDAGLTRWIQQGMRHSFCSYWLATHEDVNKLVLQSGHTDAETMWEHYHKGTTRAEAKKFWAIRPAKAAENVIPFQKAANG
jgi:integrase